MGIDMEQKSAPQDRLQQPEDRQSKDRIDPSRRDLAKKIAYVAPVVATLSVTPMFAQAASGSDDGGF